MPFRLRSVLPISSLLVIGLVNSLCAAEPMMSVSPRLQTLVDGAVQQTLEKFASKKLEKNELAVTLVDLSQPEQLAKGGYRQGEQVYPASVVKLFYLAAVHRWLEDGKIKDGAELRRAMRDMI